MTVTFQHKDYTFHTQKEIYTILLGLREEGLFAIHATAFHYRPLNHTVLIIGPSGVGKSTLTHEMPDRTIIHEDKPLLCIKNQVLCVLGHPFHLDQPLYTESIYGIDTIIYLEKDIIDIEGPFEGDPLTLISQHSIGLCNNKHVIHIVKRFQHAKITHVKTTHTYPITENIIHIIKRNINKNTNQ